MADRQTEEAKKQKEDNEKTGKFAGAGAGALAGAQAGTVLISDSGGRNIYRRTRRRCSRQ